MSVFVDTSALVAVLDADESQHSRAAGGWTSLLTSEEPLISTNYVVVETCSLVQRRLGMKAVRVLTSDLLPLIELIWVDEQLHRLAVAAFLAAGRRSLSLVDCASFEAMRLRGVRKVFTLDRDFSTHGFECLP